MDNVHSAAVVPKKKASNSEALCAQYIRRLHCGVCGIQAKHLEIIRNI